MKIKDKKTSLYIANSLESAVYFTYLKTWGIYGTLFVICKLQVFEFYGPVNKVMSSQLSTTLTLFPGRIPGCILPVLYAHGSLLSVVVRLLAL